MLHLTIIKTDIPVNKVYGANGEKLRSTPHIANGAFEVRRFDTLNMFARYLENIGNEVLVLGTPPMNAGRITPYAAVGEDPSVIARTKENFKDEVSFVLLDIDTSDTITHIKPSLAPQTEEEAIEVARQIFGDVSFIIKPSSSRIAKGTNNWHIYLPQAVQGVLKKSKNTLNITWGDWG